MFKVCNYSFRMINIKKFLTKMYSSHFVLFIVYNICALSETLRSAIIYIYINICKLNIYTEMLIFPAIVTHSIMGQHLLFCVTN